MPTLLIMKIIQKIANKSKNIYENSPVTIAFLGDSVTQGCFECYFDEQNVIQTVFDARNAYPTHIKEILNKTEGIERALEELMQGKTLECEYNEKITFLDLEKDLSIDTALNFLVLTGYLSVEKVYMENNQKRIKVKIPNGEVASAYLEEVQKY